MRINNLYAVANSQMKTTVTALDGGAPRDALRISDVSEVVADRWLDHVSIGAYRCDARMLKGGAAQEDAKWRRFSSRRRLPNAAVHSSVGFRVVRGLK